MSPTAITRRGLLTGGIAVTAAAAGCTSGISQSDSGSSASASAADSNSPATITLMTFLAGAQKDFLDGLLTEFHAKVPWVTVKHTAGQQTDTMLQAISGGQAVDLALFDTAESVPTFANSGVFIPLTAYIDRDKLPDDTFTPAAKAMTSWKDQQYAFPMLVDTWGLVYRSDLLDAAGVSVPKTWDELAAAAKKLTVKNSDGSLKQIGYMPYLDFMESNPRVMTPVWSLTWYGSDGKAAFSSEQNWKDMLTWNKELINFYGAKPLADFRAKLGDELSASNPLYTGQVAMMVDGEWRLDFIKNQKSGLKYGVAPLPAKDQANYGAGYLSANVLGITKNSKRPDAAWELLKFLCADSDNVVKLANGWKSIPSTTASMASQDVRTNADLAKFIDIASNKASAALPPTLAGTGVWQLVTQNMAKWQSSTDTDPTAFLKTLETQVNAQLQQAG